MKIAPVPFTLLAALSVGACSHGGQSFFAVRNPLEEETRAVAGWLDGSRRGEMPSEEPGAAAAELQMGGRATAEVQVADAPVTSGDAVLGGGKPQPVAERGDIESISGERGPGDLAPGVVGGVASGFGSEVVPTEVLTEEEDGVAAGLMGAQMPWVVAPPRSGDGGICYPCNGKGYRLVLGERALADKILCPTCGGTGK